MKKLSVFVSFYTALFALSAASFAQPGVDAAQDSMPELTVRAITTDSPAVTDAPVAPGVPITASVPATPGVPSLTPVPPAQQVLPFGYPPYPTAGGYPAYGVPYSYPRAARRARVSRPTPPSFQPYQLPTPGSVPAAPYAYAPNQSAHRAPLQETIGIGDIPATTPYSQQPTVVYRPTPIKNFISMLTAPRPYIGYDPYAGYPPYPGYVPPQ